MIHRDGIVIDLLLCEDIREIEFVLPKERNVFTVDGSACTYMQMIQVNIQVA